jgi:TolA-binding protein
MICPNCKKTLPDNSKFCYYCGEKLTAATETRNTNPVNAAPQARSPQPVIPGVNGKTRTIIAVSSGAILLFAIIVFFTVIFPSIRYGNADKQFASGNYSEAIETYTSLGNYKEAPARLRIAQYQQAAAWFVNGNYKLAADQFRLLGSYQDAAELAVESTYLLAEQYVTNKQYNNAVTEYTWLGDYKDSAELAVEATYLWAVSLRADGYHAEAFDMFLILGDYKKSLELATESGKTLLSAMLERGYDEIKGADSKKSLEELFNEGGYSLTFGLVTSIGTGIFDSVFGTSTQIDSADSDLFWYLQGSESDNLSVRDYETMIDFFSYYWSSSTTKTAMYKLITEVARTHESVSKSQYISRADVRAIDVADKFLQQTKAAGEIAAAVLCYKEYANLVLDKTEQAVLDFLQNTPAYTATPNDSGASTPTYTPGSTSETPAFEIKQVYFKEFRRSDGIVYATVDWWRPVFYGNSAAAAKMNAVYDKPGLTPTTSGYWKLEPEHEFHEFADYFEEGFEDVEEVSLTYQKNGIISFASYFYEYTGGAYPVHFTSGHTFKLSTGDELGLDDILKVNQYSVGDILAYEFSKKFELPDDMTWADVSYASTLDIPFYLAEDGVHIYYSAFTFYRSYGEKELIIPYSRTDLVRDEFAGAVATGGYTQNPATLNSWLRDDSLFTEISIYWNDTKNGVMTVFGGYSWNRKILSRNGETRDTGFNYELRNGTLYLDPTTAVVHYTFWDGGTGYFVDVEGKTEYFTWEGYIPSDSALSREMARFGL